ncbi:hypothetical protein [Muricoccus aerilatus]|uniref:hypothetical protein n=1 Tax=Muricoccus aerilatus TaxID=452982 RepID=UPI0012EB1E82|nr:hypothetical protein [Roseomonas aerilata]
MSGLTDSQGWTSLEEGTRLGRYVTVRDTNGVLHAVATSAVAAICETEDGALLMLPGGRMVQVEHSLRTVLSWLEVGVR